MLSFGLKITWFSLSLSGASVLNFHDCVPDLVPSSGLLSSLVVIPAFARATNELWLPLSYCAANTVLQGIFCLGESTVYCGAVRVLSTFQV